MTQVIYRISYSLLFKGFKNRIKMSFIVMCH